MRTVFLGDVCEIISGATPKTNEPNYWGGDINWITPAEIAEDTRIVVDTQRHLTAEGFQSAHLTLMPKGTVLLTSRAPIGKVAIAGNPMCCNQGFKNLICSEDINNEYLFHYLKSNVKQLQSAGRGATFKELSKRDVSRILIPLPSIEEQQKICLLFNEIDRAIQKHKKFAEGLEQLIRSRFIEMFGDPVKNPKNWCTESLGTICSKIGSGATPRGGNKNYILEGIPFIRSMNVYNGRFERKDLAHISTVNANKLKSVTLEKGDVLLNITGASVGRSCVLPDDLAGGRVNQHVSILRPICSIILPLILNSNLISDSYQNKLLSISKMAGATREAITKDQLSNLVIPIPPLGLQNRYVNFFEKVSSIRILIHQAIDKLQLLYDKLAQEYFWAYDD